MPVIDQHAQSQGDSLQLTYRWDSVRQKTIHRSKSGVRAEEYGRSVPPAIWDNQAAYVEVWLEKDALRGVLEPITNKWDVPLQISRGYASLSFLHGAADIEREDKPTFIYYFGDHDPSGVNIPRTIEKTLREMTPGSDITFTRAAVLPDQIASMNLPTRPTETSDPRSKGFQGESVEVDAIPVSVIRKMVNDCITRHLERRTYEQLLRVEREERETLRSIATAYEEGRP